MTVLVTGWTGLLGGHVVNELRRRGQRDLLLLSRTARADEPQSIGADLTEPCQLSAINWQRVTDVIHCAAAIPSRADDFADTNVAGTRNLLDALKAQQLRSFVLTSSVSVYATDQRQVDAAKVTQGYGWTKLRQEELTRNELDDNTAVSIFRLSSVYGAGMAQNTVLPIFVDRARANSPLTITKPHYIQNFISARDAAWVLVESMTRRVRGTFNLFSDTTVTLKTLAREITRATSSSSTILCKPEESTPRPADHAGDHLGFDNRRLKRELPGIQFQSLAEGLQEMLRDR